MAFACERMGHGDMAATISMFQANRWAEVVNATIENATAARLPQHRPATRTEPDNLNAPRTSRERRAWRPASGSKSWIRCADAVAAVISCARMLLGRLTGDTAPFREIPRQALAPSCASLQGKKRGHI